MLYTSLTNKFFLMIIFHGRFDAILQFTVLRLRYIASRAQNTGYIIIRFKKIRISFLTSRKTKY